MTEKKKKIYRYLILTGYVIIFLFALIFSFLLILIFFTPSSSNFQTKDLETYQIYRLNPKTNETTFGFVTIFEHLESDEYISYVDEESGTKTLISPVGEDEYECRGSCFCKDTSNPEQTVIHYLEDFTLLLTSNTPETAELVMDDHLENVCSTRYSPEVSDVCVPSETMEMYGETARCELATEADRKRKWVAEEFPHYNPAASAKWFLCKGNCLPVVFTSADEYTKLSQEYGCEIANKRAKLEIDISDLLPSTETTDQQEEKKNDYESINNPEMKSKYKERAKTTFIDENLSDFCKMISIHHDSIKDEKGHIQPVSVPLCFHKLVDGTNPSVWCRAIPREEYFTHKPFRDIIFEDPDEEGEEGEGFH